jgi:hypothetical protein
MLIAFCLLLIPSRAKDTTPKGKNTTMRETAKCTQISNRKCKSGIMVGPLFFY